MRKLAFISLKSLLVFLFIAFLILANPTSSVAYFGAKYEPADGRKIHGLGQYSGFGYTDEENWWDVVSYQTSSNKIPLFYSVYYPINPKAAQYGFFPPITGFLTNMVRNNPNCAPNNRNCPYLIFLSLGYFEFDPENIGDDFTQLEVNSQAIISGQWDQSIREIAREVKSLGQPVFLRPGYEFGIGADGAHSHVNLGPTAFIACWNHIQNIFNQEQVTNVAWVWGLVNPNQFNYMSYYPGDNKVDWWGVNYFTTGQMQNSLAFLNDARNHNKPVMIPESCPIHNGGTENNANWDAWFVPYFNIIKSYNHIKAFFYISDPWDKPGLWDHWANSRISASSYISSRYATELNNSIYIHLPEYLSNPGVIGGGGTPPSTPPVPPTTPPPSGITGDLNGDGVVDINDGLILLNNWGRTGTPPIPGDANNDGKVNTLDAAYVMRDWGKTF
jgi:hypothetical protein